MIEFEEPTRFTACPAYIPGETGQSYLGRLTGFFGCPTPKEFCKDFMLDLQGIQHGEPIALRRLAAMTGADADALVQWTPRRIDYKFMELAGEKFDNRFNSRHRIAICPLCAKEDIAANPSVPLDQAVYGRPEWVLGIVDCCRHHDTRLVTHQATPGSIEKLDIVYQSGFLLEELDRLPIEKAELDDFQRYVLSRIGVIDFIPSPLLDSLPLVTVAQFCHAAGLDLLQRRGHPGTPTDNERRASGFEMFGHGNDGLERVVIEMRKGLIPSERATRIMRRLLEYMHEASSVQRDLGDLPAVLTDHLFRLLPYGPGEVVLGRVCREASVYDFRDARRVYNMPRHYLHAFVLGTPALAVQIGSRRGDSLIDKCTADRIFLGRTPFISSTELTRFVGRQPRCSRADVSMLVDAGIFHPVAEASTEEMPPIFSMPEVERDIAAFLARFQRIDPETPGLYTVTEISNRCQVHFRDLWKLLASGKVKRLAVVEGAEFFLSIRLHARDIIEAITGVPSPMTVDEVKASLRITNPRIRSLIAQGILLPAVWTSDVHSSIVDVFAKSDIDAFNARYVNESTIQTWPEAEVLLERIRETGLLSPPELTFGQIGPRRRNPFYKRADVEALM